MLADQFTKKKKSKKKIWRENNGNPSAERGRIRRTKSEGSAEQQVTDEDALSLARRTPAVAKPALHARTSSNLSSASAKIESTTNMSLSVSASLSTDSGQQQINDDVRLSTPSVAPFSFDFAFPRSNEQNDTGGRPKRGGGNDFLFGFDPISSIPPASRQKQPQEGEGGVSASIGIAAANTERNRKRRARRKRAKERRKREQCAVELEHRASSDFGNDGDSDTGVSFETMSSFVESANALSPVSTASESIISKNEMDYGESLSHRGALGTATPQNSVIQGTMGMSGAPLKTPQSGQFLLAGFSGAAEKSPVAKDDADTYQSFGNEKSSLLHGILNVNTEVAPPKLVLNEARENRQKRDKKQEIKKQSRHTRHAIQRDVASTSTSSKRPARDRSSGAIHFSSTNRGRAMINRESIAARRRDGRSSWGHQEQISLAPDDAGDNAEAGYFEGNTVEEEIHRGSDTGESNAFSFGFNLFDSLSPTSKEKKTPHGR